jgi:hypothetical protein
MRSADAKQVVKVSIIEYTLRASYVRNFTLYFYPRRVPWFVWLLLLFLFHFFLHEPRRAVQSLANCFRTSRAPFITFISYHIVLFAEMDTRSSPESTGKATSPLMALVNVGRKPS